MLYIRGDHLLYSFDLKMMTLNLGVILLEDIKCLSLLHVKEFTNLLGVHVFHILTRTIAWEYIWWYHLTPSNCLSSVLKNLSMYLSLSSFDAGDNAVSWTSLPWWYLEFQIQQKIRVSYLNSINFDWYMYLLTKRFSRCFLFSLQLNHSIASW